MMRALLDSLIIGLKGEPKDVKKKLGHALHSRMTFQPIHISPLSEIESLEFLEAFLNRSSEKIGDKSSKVRYFPFTEESIKTLVELTCPATPRRLLRVSSLIFEQAKLEKKKIIDKDFVLDIAIKFGKVSIKLPKIEPKTDEEVVEKKQPISPKSAKNNLEGIIQFGSDGVPNLLVDPEKLTAKEIIGLILYSQTPNSISLSELKTLIVRNWRQVPSSYLSANLAQMKRHILREGIKGSYEYKLSNVGKSWVKNTLLPKIRTW